MSEAEEVGFIEEKKCEEIEIEWKIPDIFTVVGNKTDIYCPIFSFANTQWRLQLSFQPSGMRLCIRRIEICSEICGVEYSLGLKRADGSFKSVCRRKVKYLEGDDMRIGPFYIRELERVKSEFAPANMLVINCTLKRSEDEDEEPISDQPKVVNFLRLNTIIKTDLLSQNLKDLLSNKESCDTILLVKDKEFQVHRAILIARSSVFAAMFRHDTTEKLTGNVIIDDCDPDSFQLFLEYLYTGKLDDISSGSVIELYKISDKYNVPELKLFCTNYLDLNLTVKDVCEVVTFANEYNEKSLKSSAKWFFNANVKEILETSEWENLLKNNFSLANKLLIKMVKDKEETLDMVKRMKRY